MRGIVARLLVLAAAAVFAVAAWVGAAALRPEFAFLAAAALAAFLGSGYAMLRAVDARAGRSDRRRRWAWLGAGAAVYMAVAHLAIGRSPEPAPAEPDPPGRLNHWSMPDGARLAYVHVPAAGPARPTPVIMLHGGPGMPLLPALAAGGGPLDFLARAGYDVYYYDQRGAGFSSRFDLRRGGVYTVAGHVADLEAIRRALGADRIIPVGHGWGATLAMQYLLAHPDRVARMVALAPAPLWYPAFPDMINPAARVRLTEVQGAALALLERPPPRLVIGRLTAATSRRAAHTLIADWEADRWWSRATEAAMQLGQPNMTCSTDPARGLPPLAGLGFFAYSYTMDDALRLPDPRPALATLDTPVLIVRGLCDYIRWEVAFEYQQLLPGAAYVSIPAGGHLLWLEQKGLLEQVIPPFLAGDVVPLSYYHPGRTP